MRAFAPILTITFLLVTAAVARDPWATLGGLTQSQVQSRAEILLNSGAGVVPLQISGYDSWGTPRYSVLWGPGDRHERTIIAGLTTTAFTTTNAILQVNGWRLTWLSGYRLGGVDYYNGIYRKSGGAAQLLRLDDTEPAFQAARDQLGDTHTLTDFCAFRSGSAGVRYGAFWTERSGGIGAFRPELHTGLTAAQLIDLVTDRVDRWRIGNLCGYPDGSGGTRYSVLLRRFALAGFLYHIDLSAQNYAAINENYIGMGWRPTFVQAWGASSSDTRYNAIWVPNGGLDGEHIESLDNLVTSAMASQNIPALSLAISKDGKLVYNRAWGLADIADNELAGTSHRFRIASCSKAITGLAAVHALEHGDSGRTLDSKMFGAASISGFDFAPQPFGFEPNELDISLRDLLQHVTGWGEGKLWYYSEPIWGSDNVPAIIDQLATVSPPTPGTIGLYSNLGFVTAARALEYISGQSYEDYVDEQIFAACGATGILRPVVGGRTAAEGKLLEVSYYTGPSYGNPTTTADPSVVDPRRMDGSTAWVARPSDLLLVARRVDGDGGHADIIDGTSLAALRAPGPMPQTSSGYVPATYGLGWYRESSYFGHNGWMPGTQADYMVGANGLSFAWVANTVGGISNSSLRSILNTIEARSDWPNLDLFGTFHPTYQSWMEQHFAPIEYVEIGLQEALWGPDADPDNDGLPNALECYLGKNPRTADPSPFHVSKSGPNMRVSWFRRLNVPGLSIDYETSTDLENWLPSRPATGTIGDNPGIITPVGFRRQELQLPMDSAGERHVRFFSELH